MKLSEFKFNLPSTLLADRPSVNRDESRLMVVNRKEGTIEHKKEFKDILNYFDDQDAETPNDMGFDAIKNSLSSGVDKLFHTRGAFAALKDDGSVVTWGRSTYGGDSTGV